MEPPMPNRIYRLPDAIGLTGLCRSALYKALKEKSFPEPVLLGKRAVGWRESDLTAWIDSRQKRSAAKD